MRAGRRGFVAWAALFAVICPGAAVALPAFPGAEGFGSETAGGRGGAILEVTNVNDSGAGSLRAACGAAGPRIIVFRTGGTIVLKTDLWIRSPYVTLAGQTAPGDGIALRGAALRIATHDVVVRNVRVRVGDDPAGPDPENRDGIAIEHPSVPPYNVVLDHCSVSWAVDGNVDLWYPMHDITIQHCLLAEALRSSLHPKGAHSTGLLLGQDAHRLSVHHNYLAHNDWRNPRIQGNQPLDLVNNLVYDWGAGGAVSTDGDEVRGTDSHVNVIGNVYQKGPSTTGRAFAVEPQGPGTIFVLDNLGPTRASGSLPEWAFVEPSSAPSLQRAARWPAPPITTHPARAVRELVLAAAGALAPRRDPLDARVVEDARRGTGRLIDSPADVAGFPAYATGTPPADADHDGMPDAWEASRGLDPRDPKDGPGDRDGDGYTNVEEFLNELMGYRSAAPDGGDAGVDAGAPDAAPASGDASLADASSLDPTRGAEAPRASDGAGCAQSSRVAGGAGGASWLVAWVAAFVAARRRGRPGHRTAQSRLS